MAGKISTKYQRLVVGGQLGHMEYVVTEENLALFRNAVDYPEAGFPSIAVKEPAHVLARKFGPLPLFSVKHQERYFRPPQLNRRVQVTGWVREKYQQRGRSWLEVETFAVDEIGTEILRSRHTFLVGESKREGMIVAEAGPEVGDPLPTVTKCVGQENIDLFRAVGHLLTSQDRTQPSVPVRSNTDVEQCRSDGSSRSRASDQMGFAYLHEILARRFGADFRQGGQLSVTFLGSVYAGDLITAHGVVNNDEPVEHRTRLTLRVWLENQKGELIATGDAQVTIPSPLT